jgi:hypothetical protein
MGVALSARTYSFDADVPFETSDIVDLQAVVKHLSPVCGDARDLLESGKVRLAQVKLPHLSLLSPLCVCVSVCVVIAFAWCVSFSVLVSDPFHFTFCVCLLTPCKEQLLLNN